MIPNIFLLIGITSLSFLIVLIDFNIYIYRQAMNPPDNTPKKFLYR